MKRKMQYEIGDLVLHRFLDFGYGIIIEKRNNTDFGEFMNGYVVHFPKSGLQKLLYWTEMCDEKDR
jgi:hypothetical protein